MSVLNTKHRFVHWKAQGHVAWWHVTYYIGFEILKINPTWNGFFNIIGPRVRWHLLYIAIIQLEGDTKVADYESRDGKGLSLGRVRSNLNPICLKIHLSWGGFYIGKLKPAPTFIDLPWPGVPIGYLKGKKLYSVQVRSNGFILRKTEPNASFNMKNPNPSQTSPIWVKSDHFAILVYDLWCLTRTENEQPDSTNNNHVRSVSDTNNPKLTQTNKHVNRYRKEIDTV